MISKFHASVIVTALILSVLLVGCTSTLNEEGSLLTRKSPTPEPTPSNTQEEAVRQIFVKAWEPKLEDMTDAIEQARAKWMQKGIDSYSFVASKWVGGVSSPWNRSPVRITVTDGKAGSLKVVNRKDVSMLERTDGFEEFDTVGKLFDYMLQEVRAGRIVEATYDRKLGFPKSVSLIHSFGPHGTRGIEISGFRRAEADNERR